MEITRKDGYICISYDKDIRTPADGSLITSYNLNESIPVSFPMREKPAGLEATYTSEEGPTEVQNMQEFPYDCCGQVHMTFTRFNSNGSASLLKRPDMILTAAHCMYDSATKSYPTLTRFYLQRKDNAARAMQLVARVFIPEEYIQSGDMRYDYAICVLDKCISGSHHVLDFSTAIKDFHTTTVGYPGAQPYSGTKMYYTKNLADIRTVNGMDYLHVNNGLAYGGASGGPWVFDGKVAGLSSWGWAGHEVFSPIFNDKFTALYNEALKFAPTKTISKFKLENSWGWFVCELHVRHSDDIYKDTTDIRINETRETSLIGHISAFEAVSIKAFIAGGYDKNGSEIFIFDPNAINGAHYKISGTTCDSTLSYQGIY